MRYDTCWYRYYDMYNNIVIYDLSCFAHEMVHMTSDLYKIITIVLILYLFYIYN
ncbi:Hypothetical protein ORPV_1103 [Orpheovirus IHUMI-LCC2]|uniref:Uncharacterized protein n=1 Tax=Orpheovirus IHUMI-LCC2 TaxID=2023057 RepID=A0A2I2L652_9VIRU|nr:Hypothetical protein ORPV_1103 [Orpheovirus IHUMI-LCC2]SNW63007.1 Hypothetical protein ORPV_1103 [Orpheovirus IHUMI-LCC2]